VPAPPPLAEDAAPAGADARSFWARASPWARPEWAAGSPAACRLLLAALVTGALRSFPLLLSSLATCVALACSSDRLLGELQLASGGKLLWNAQRVAGVQRETLRAASAAVAVVGVSLSPVTSITWFCRAVLIAFALAILHAVLRPLDLKGSFSSFVSDLQSATTREDVKDAMKNVGERLTSWWSDVKATPDVPVVVVGPAATASQAASGARKPPQERGRLPGH
jgi:hypothetical protein